MPRPESCLRIPIRFFLSSLCANAGGNRGPGVRRDFGSGDVQCQRRAELTSVIKHYGFRSRPRSKRYWRHAAIFERPTEAFAMDDPDLGRRPRKSRAGTLGAGAGGRIVDRVDHLWRDARRFLLGIWNARANATGAIAGMLVGLATMITVNRFTPLAWTWYALTGTLVTFVSGSIVSAIWRGGPASRGATIGDKGVSA